MGDLFSTISGQFSRDFILGAFLPVVVFLLLFAIFVSPLLPPDLLVVPALDFLTPEWQWIPFTFAALILTGLVFNFKGPIIRFYEGYPWQRSLLGKWLAGRHRRKYLELKARLEGYHALIQADPDREITKKWNDLNKELNKDYPERAGLVLPTRLGNVIRSFERYPAWQYDIESIEVWPRLRGVIEKDYASAIDEALGSLSFLLNLSLLSGSLGMLILGAGVWNPPDRFLLRVLLPAAIAGGLSYFLYLVAIPQANRWGVLFKGAFDLYRWDLLKKMGYRQMPKERKEERRLWRAISFQTMLGDRQIGMGRREPRLPYEAPLARGDQALPKDDPAAFYTHSIDYLQVSRGLRPASGDGTLTVVLAVRNADPEIGALEDIEVLDLVPPGFEYVWGSACADGRQVVVSGVNPYLFKVEGSLEPDEELVMNYRVMPRHVVPPADGRGADEE